MTPARWIGLSLEGATEEEIAKAAPLLAQAAEAYLTAGGVVTPELWMACSVQERAALMAAGQRLAVLRAAWAGRAAHGERPAAEVLSLVDGGEIHDDMLLFENMQALRERIEGLRGR